jgi:hypothetical protein
MADTPEKKTFKKIVVEWVKESTSHGLPRIIKSKYLILKILWAIAFCSGIAAVTYYLINTLTAYFQYQPVVQVTRVDEFPTIFPSVTICNLIPFVNLSRLGLTNEKVLFNQDSFDSLNLDYYFVEAQENLKRRIANLSKIDQKSTGFQLNDKTLISCRFNKEICDSSNFTSYFNYDYGNCYTFNGGDNKNDILKTTLIGSKYGLTLEILTGDPTIQLLPETNSGLLLVAHNQTKSLLPSIELNNGIFIPTGYNSYVSVSREFRSKLPSPYSNCITNLTTSQKFGSVLYDYMIQSNITTYDQPSCVRLCYQTVVQNVCDCYDPKYPSLGNMTIKCLNFYQVECILNVTNNIFLNGNDYQNICGFGCPIACESVDYSLSTSMSSYPSQYYVDALEKKNYLKNFNTTNKRELLNDVKNNIVRVTINYNQLGYTLIQEQASLDLFSLIGNVGGQCGLFLGLSALSFIEIIELLIDLIIFSRKMYTF